LLEEGGIKMYKKCLIVRYGELFLKRKNRNDFIQKLIDNITLTFQKNNLSGLVIKKFSDQLIITAKEEKELTNLLPILKNIFGISTFFLAY
jgi:tRNA uracil 4-sulfurtransferase